MITLSRHEGVWDRLYVEDLEAAALELQQLKSRKQMSAFDDEEDVIEHTIPTDFLSEQDTRYLTNLCGDFLRENGFPTDAFGFAVQIITPSNSGTEI
jgi:hypothetical protein